MPRKAVAAGSKRRSRVGGERHREIGEMFRREAKEMRREGEELRRVAEKAREDAEKARVVAEAARLKLIELDAAMRGQRGSLVEMRESARNGPEDH